MADRTPTSVTQFIQLLKALRIRAGQPSLRDLERRTCIPASTINDALNEERRTLPKRDLARALAEELGGPSARARIEHAWDAVAQQPTSTSAPPSQHMRPQQLPAPPAGFAGRETYLAHLDTAPQPITVITGSAGVGKTALAVEWAHRHNDRFRDGQLFLDLHGHAAAPPTPTTRALSLLLQSLGVAGESIPLDLELQSGMFRSLVAGRRMLLVLDNAHDVDQVRPLLPGTPTCRVLITSRNQLGSLAAREGAGIETLNVLAEDEALAVLAAQLGTQRVEAQPRVAVELTRLCAYLPMALRIAAANLAVRPADDLAGFAAQLRGANRLAKLRVIDDPDTAVTAALDLSYAALEPDAQHVLQLIGLLPGPEVSRQAVAVLADRPPDDPMPALDRLAAAHLVDSIAGPDRFHCHDLLFEYARRSARHLPISDATAAVERLYAWYLLTADTAADLLNPTMRRLDRSTLDLDGTPTHFSGRAEARHWLDQELPALQALIRHAADVGPRHMAWHLADTLRGYLYASRRDTDWLACAPAALAAAEAEQDPGGMLSALISLAIAAAYRDDHDVALTYLRRALPLADTPTLGAWRGSILNNLGDTLHRTGNLAEAADYYQQALDTVDASDPTIAVLLINLAAVHRDMGRLTTAVEFGRRAVAAAEQTAAGVAHCAALGVLASVESLHGHHDQALDHYEQALRLARETAFTRGEIDVLAGLGTTYSRMRHHDQALTYIRQVIALVDARQSRGQEEHTLVAVIEVLLAADLVDEAIHHAEKALGVHRKAGHQLAEARTRLLLGQACTAAGDHDTARDHLRRGRHIAQNIGAAESEELARLLDAEATRGGV